MHSLLIALTGLLFPAKRQGSNVRRDLSLADRGDLRRVRRTAELGIEVSIANIIGLTLAVLIALLLVGALIFPERF